VSQKGRILSSTSKGRTRAADDRYRPRLCDNWSQAADKQAGNSDRVLGPDRCDQGLHSQHLDRPLQVVCQHVQA
jgi:hypothetical protein